MLENTIITFGRQFGSGGHEVAKKVSEMLGIPYYDKELIAHAAKKSGLSENLFEGLDEKPTNSFLYSLVMGLQLGNSSYYRYGDITDVDNIFRIQSQAIKEIADEGPCVIVGRCADYILRDRENLVKVFIHAGMDFRTKRVMERDDMKEKAAIDYITKSDKRRASFYNFYTNGVWGSVDNYNLSVDTEKLGIDKSAELIVNYVNLMG